MQRTLLRTVAVLLALATSARLVQLGSDDPRPMSVLFYARALVIGALLHVGLFCAPDAQRVWPRTAIALLMLPSVVVMLSVLGDAVSRATRGLPLELFATATSIIGLITYSVALWSLARRPLPLPNAPFDRTD